MLKWRFNLKKKTYSSCFKNVDIISTANVVEVCLLWQDQKQVNDQQPQIITWIYIHYSLLMTLTNFDSSIFQSPEPIRSLQPQCMYVTTHISWSHFISTVCVEKIQPYWYHKYLPSKCEVDQMNSCWGNRRYRQADRDSTGLTIVMTQCHGATRCIG